MLMDIYVMDYDTLRGTKDDDYTDLYESIPLCYKNNRFVNMEVISIPKENEIILLQRNGSILAMHVYKVVYYQSKIFVIVNNTESDLSNLETKHEEDVPKIEAKPLPFRTSS